MSQHGRRSGQRQPSIAVSGGGLSDSAIRRYGVHHAADRPSWQHFWESPRPALRVTFSVPANGAGATLAPRRLSRPTLRVLGRSRLRRTQLPAPTRSRLAPPASRRCSTSLTNAAAKTNAAANPARNWDDTCNPVMDAVACEYRFGHRCFEYSAPSAAAGLPSRIRCCGVATWDDARSRSKRHHDDQGATRQTRRLTSDTAKVFAGSF